MSPRTRRLLRRAAGLVSGALLVGALAALVWWGTVLPRPATAPVSAAAVSVPTAEIVYSCPAAPANTIGGVDVGRTAAATILSPAVPGTAMTYAGRDLDGGTTVLKTAEGGILTVDQGQDEVAGAVGAVTTLSATGDLRGLTSAPCVPPSAVSWIVGGSAAIGSSAELRLTNPGVTTVTATVHLYGSTGELSLPSGGQLSVPAGQTVGLLLETEGSGNPRLALSVEADSGSLMTFLVTETLDGETAAGTEVITPGASPATEQIVPGVVLVEQPAPHTTATEEPAGSGPPLAASAPVVRVVNPGTEPANVSVSLIGADGETDLPGAQDVLVDPGAVFDISLAGTAPGTYGVRVTSDQPVGAAVSLLRAAGEYPERSGTLLRDVAWAQAASPAAVESGAVALPRNDGITPSLVLTNAGTASATVTLSSLDGSWTQEVAVPATTTLTAEVPQDVDAVTLSAPTGQSVSATVVLTAEVTGDTAGTLISVLPPTADADSLARRSMILR